jgi:hypothetical protein
VGMSARCGRGVGRTGTQWAGLLSAQVLAEGESHWAAKAKALNTGRTGTELKQHWEWMQSGVVGVGGIMGGIMGGGGGGGGDGMLLQTMMPRPYSEAQQAVRGRSAPPAINPALAGRL